MHIMPINYTLHRITTTCKNCAHVSVSSEMMTCVPANNGRAWRPSHLDATIYDLEIKRNEVSRVVPLCIMCVDATIEAKRLTPLPKPVFVDPKNSNLLPGEKPAPAPKTRALSDDELFVE